MHARLDSWLRGLRKQRRLAVILGASVNGLSFVRSLGRRSVPTLLLDSDRQLGIYTRYGRFDLLRPVEEHPDEWVSLLSSNGSRLSQRGVLCPTSDAHTLFVSARAHEHSRHYRFVTAPPETIERILDKRLQYTRRTTANPSRT